MLTNDFSAIMGLNIPTSEPPQIVRKESVATTQKMASKEEKSKKLKITLNSFLCNDLQFYCQSYIHSFQPGQGPLLTILFVSEMLK